MGGKEMKGKMTFYKWTADEIRTLRKSEVISEEVGENWGLPMPQIKILSQAGMDEDVLVSEIDWKLKKQELIG